MLQESEIESANKPGRQPVSWMKLAVGLLKFAVSAGILTWLFLRAKADSQFAELASSNKDWIAIAAAFLLCLAAHVISFYRWRILVNALGIPFATADAVRIGLIGMFFGYISLGVVAGDSLRMFYAARLVRERLGDVVCTVFADRAIGMLTMFTFATIGFMVMGIDETQLRDPAHVRALQILLFVVAASTLFGWAVVAVLMLVPGIGQLKLIHRLQQIPVAGRIFRQLTGVVELYRAKAGALAVSLGLSVLVNVCFIGTIFLIARGIEVPRPSLAQHVLIAPMSMTANAVPLPGGIGGMELMLSYFYDAMSPDSSHGFLVALAFRLTLLALAAIGAIAWFLNRRQIAEVVQQIPE